MNMKRKIIVAVTGASGAIYARLLMETLSRLEEQVAEAAVMLSANAARIWEYELEKAFSPPPPPSGSMKTMTSQPLLLPVLPTGIPWWSVPAPWAPWDVSPTASPTTWSPAPQM